MLFASTSLAIWAAVVARGRRAVPGSVAFSWLLGAVAIWTLTAALETIVTDRGAQILIAKVQYVGIAPTGALWLAFTSAYARAAWLKNRIVQGALWVVPVITIALAATNESHHALWAVIADAPGPSARLVYQGGPWYWVNVGAIYAQMAIGTLILAAGLRRFPPPYRRQTWVILVGAAIPWVSNALYHARMLPPGLDPTPVAFTASGLCFGWGLYRYRRFGLVPVARDMVVDSMDDGVLVLDSHRRIVDLNAAAERYTGCTPASLGQPIDEVVSWWTRAVTDDFNTTEQPAVVKTEPGPRYFEVKVSAVRDSQRRFVGWLVVIHDISQRRRGEAERYALDRRVQEQQKSESLMVLAGGVA
ncbi:MAG: PAS domain-containing protein, partial [Mycobacteriaceae bacterium]|nr:PAS domain-containing protein [Mycobacteriaceae bacterium]